MDTLKIISALGGHSIHCHVYSDQENLSEKSVTLDKGSHIILGTPSCVQEIIEHGSLMTSSIRVIVFDRLDKMISKRSNDAIENILQVIPQSAQVVFLLSETFTKLGDLASKLGDLTTKSMHNPSWIRHEGPEAIPNEIVFSFNNMDLKSDLLCGISAYGLKLPSTIQKRAIPPILKGQDVIVEAQSEPDKVAIISIPILQKLDASNKQCQALVLVPSHEQAPQLRNVVLVFGSSMNIQCHVCIGGSSVREDINALKNGTQIVVGTPGRVLDMIKRGALKTDSVKMFVMEGNFTRTFVNDLKDIFQRLPSGIQTVAIAAKMNKGGTGITSKLMLAPLYINDELPLVDAKRFYVTAKKEKAKLDTLCGLCDRMAATHIVVFCNTLQKVDWLKERLSARKIAVEAIREQSQGEEIMKKFSSGSFRVLIATDSELGSINVRRALLVINFDLPTIKKQYKDRMDILGRFGRKGDAINIVIAKELVKMREYDHYYSAPAIEMSVEDFA
ncbi:translation initiation factor eIF4A [Mortierella sp. NVP85]|nr:translation initiation factor eIF4A [Mortierella sp. NVP85]